MLVGASSFGSRLQELTFGILNEGVFAVGDAVFGMIRFPSYGGLRTPTGNTGVFYST